ncbi:MAG: hypothetical protein MI923_18875 [Phycisphaerales bacterium]|nr:hypothetical protein [Phycisphaerales bacterium]
MSRQILSFLALAIVALPFGCRSVIFSPTLPQPQPTPTEPVIACSTSFFDDGIGAGFSPPDGLVGPVGSAGFPNGAQWFEQGSSAAKISFSARFVSDGTLEELAGDAARVEQFRMLGNRIIRSEPVLFDSGQEGWIIESLNEALIFGGIPPMSTVIVLLVEDQTLFELRSTGTSDESEILTTIGMSLCTGR